MHKSVQVVTVTSVQTTHFRDGVCTFRWKLCVIPSHISLLPPTLEPIHFLPPLLFMLFSVFCRTNTMGKYSYCITSKYDASWQWSLFISDNPIFQITMLNQTYSVVLKGSETTDYIFLVLTDMENMLHCIHC